MSFRVNPNSQLFPRLLLVASCVLSLTASAGAAGGDAGTPKPAGKAKKSLLLSRDELRACQASKTQMEQQRSEITRMQGALATEKTEIVRVGDELKEQLAALDRTNVELVQKYVDANNAREKRIDAFEASSSAYNDKLHGLEVALAAYKKDCENKRFDEADELAIKQGK